MYSKDTDTDQYWDNRSYHPTHVKKGKPFGQALRLRRICESNPTFNERLDELRDYFLKRVNKVLFKQSIIEEQLRNAKQVDRNTLLCHVTSRSLLNYVAAFGSICSQQRIQNQLYFQLFILLYLNC